MIPISKKGSSKNLLQQQLRIRDMQTTLTAIKDWPKLSKDIPTGSRNYLSG